MEDQKKMLQAHVRNRASPDLKKILLFDYPYPAGGSGGQGAWENVAEAGEGDCISTTHGVALKLCGPGEVSAYSSPNCAGSAETISHGTSKPAADCSEVTGNIVSIKYSCHAGNR